LKEEKRKAKMRTWKQLRNNLFGNPISASVTVLVFMAIGFWIYESDIIGKLIGAIVYPAIAIGLVIFILRAAIGGKR
jgi:hypothetical protein